MLAYYKALIELRKSHAAFCSLERKNLDVRMDEETGVVQLHRWHEDDHVLCFMNFSQKVHEIVVPPLEQHWHLLFDSADPKWKGNRAAVTTAKDQSVIVVQAQSLLIYSNH
jgi:maltooligosyltrehalose trehalohydrolase